MQAVSAHLDRVLKKQRVVYDAALSEVDLMLEALETAQRAIAGGADVAEEIAKLQTRLSTPPSAAPSSAEAGAADGDAYAGAGSGGPDRAAEEFKELYALLLRFGKSIDKCAYDNLDALWRSGAFGAEDVTRLVVEQLQRQGQAHIADKLIVESGMADNSVSASSSAQKEGFELMHSILKELQQRNIEPCLAWARDLHQRHEQEQQQQQRQRQRQQQQQQQQQQLDPQGLVGVGGVGVGRGFGRTQEDFEYEHERNVLRKVEDLQYALHRMEFLRLLWADGGTRCTEALVYSKQHLAEHAARKLDDMRRLATCVLFCTRPERAPAECRDVFLGFDGLWARTAHMFTSLFCQSMGLSERSPLESVVEASAIALPQIMRFMQLMHRTQDKELLSGEALDDPVVAVDITLSKDLQFHSTFVCPVSQEQASPENPPVVLLCGHAISKESMNRITHARRSRQFKCPTCPQVQRPSDVVEMSF